MRGLHLVWKFFMSWTGITPAYAGTTDFKDFEDEIAEDHPCICGDYLHQIFSQFFCIGSPLHMRGLPESATLIS